MNANPHIISTPGRHSHDLQFSPYFSNKVAVATSQYYGLAGSGALYVFTLPTPDTAAAQVPVVEHKWNDSLYCLSWCEKNEKLIFCGAGDGSVVVYDITQLQAPINAVKLHTREVSSIKWFLNRILAHLFITASWDGSVKIWDMMSLSCLTDLKDAHTTLIYDAVPSPLITGVFCSVSGDGFLKFWDINSPQKPTGLVKGHDSEILSADWCKYEQNILATGGTDGLIKVWDMRNHSQPVNVLSGHDYAARRVKFSPYNKEVIGSTSYDFTVRLWDWVNHSHTERILNGHTEFVCGLDWNIHVPQQMASASWDETVRIWNI